MGIPEVLEVIMVPGFLYFSIFSYIICLMSSLSTTTSIIQSTPAISCKLSSKFPVVIFLAVAFVYTGDGLLFNAACKASLTSLLRSCGLVLSVASFGTISSSKTLTPIPAK